MRRKSPSRRDARRRPDRSVPSTSDGKRDVDDRPVLPKPASARLSTSSASRPTTASVLVRRGHEDPAAARAFLEGALPGHDPFALGDMREAVERIRCAVATGARICVHGDYDADGICATALAVLLLRELGAEPTWHLPSRFEEGYGLASQTIAGSPPRASTSC